MAEYQNGMNLERNNFYVVLYYAMRVRKYKEIDVSAGKYKE